MPSKVAENSTTSSKKLGGRKKGTLNKKTEHIFEKCAELNFDVVTAMIYFAMGDWEALGFSSAEIEKQGFQGLITYEPSISTDQRLDACKTLMQYMYPKRKSIEMTVDEDAAKKGFQFAYSTGPMNGRQTKPE